MEKDALFKFMKGFRETFSRPVRRLRFLGLFDTVNSIPRFETALFERSKFPYSCQTSAKVIRHAVSIDERRVKFRQDLISDATKKNEGAARGPSALRRMSRAPKKKDQVSQLVEKQETQTKAQVQFRPPQQKGLLGEGLMSRRFTSAKSPRYRMPSRRRDESQPPNRDVASFTGVPTDQFDDSESEGEEQDVEEIWFPGECCDASMLSPSVVADVGSSRLPRRHRVCSTPSDAFLEIQTS